MRARLAALRRLPVPALLACGLLACGHDAGPAQDDRAGAAQKESRSTRLGRSIDARSLRRGNGPEPESLDPQRARSDSSLNVIRDLFEGLTMVGGDGTAVPAAAESWTASADGRQYRFRLREGLRWSNGDALVAADFVAGMRRLVDPTTASQYAQILEPVVNAAAIVAGKRPPSDLGVEAPDARTVIVRLVNPAPYLLGLMAHPSTFPIHAPSLAEHGERFTQPGRLVGNGAFVLEEWVVGSHIGLRRNRHYRDDEHTRLDHVRFVHINDPSAEFRQYRAGQIDVSYVVPQPQFAWIQQHLPGELHVSPQLSTYYYGFNLTRPPFKNRPGLRRALSLVIDRERLTTAVTGVGETPAYGWVPRGIADYTPQEFDYANTPYEERVRAARELYRQAGYSESNPLEVEIRYNTGEVHNRLAVAIAAMWKETLGVEATLYAEEFRALLASIQARSETQVFRSSWIGDFNDAYSFAQLLQSDFGINLTGYSNPQYDGLLAEAIRHPDTARRRALLEEAERLMLSDHPLLPIYFYVNKHLVKPYVRGWADNVVNVQYSRNLWLEPVH
jgi:oligopeptide transport system substrate-binding protein